MTTTTVSNSPTSSNPDYPVKVTETVDGQVQHINVDDTPGKLPMSVNREGIETSGVFGWIIEGSDLSEAGTTNTVIVATGHNVRKGDYLRFTNGATIGYDEFVLSTTTNTITLVGPVNGLTGSGYGFEILRKDALVLGANNTLNVSGSVNLVDTGSGSGALWYPDGNGQASLAVTLFDEINTVPYGASNPVPATAQVTNTVSTTAEVTNISEALKNLARLIAKPVWVSQASGEVRTSTVVSSGALTTVTTVTTVNQVAGFDARATQLFDASRTSWGSNIRGRIT
jgi:hypothetical protein